VISPYLAVLRDSFHAALSSRVLWIAFVAIWLLLIALAPFGYREDFTTDFRGRDFYNGTRMKAMLARGLVDENEQDSPAGRLAAAMPEELQRQLRLVGEGDEVRIQLSVLADALNDLLDRDDWYDQQAWSSTLRLREMRELEAADTNELSESARRRLARLRIEAALPGVFETRSSRSIVLTYAGWDFPANLAVDKTQFVSLINQWVVPVIIDWLLGFVLIFLGILVTASIIPDMLQPGSLHLLLSKPVSRTLLLLSKFIGGCAFVFLCVVQLVIGLYLIAGWRLDVWNLRLLWCIPAAVFLFSVFYSVSVVAGLRWRSPILAIGVTVIFGTICLVVGVIGGVFDGFVKGPDQIRGLVVAGETFFAATQGGGLNRFDRDQNQWVEIYESSAVNPDRVLDPVRLSETSVATARVRGGRFNPFGSGALNLLVASAANQWEPEPSVRLPTATSRLIHRGETLFAVSSGDVSRTTDDQILRAIGMDGEADGSAQTEETSGSADAGWLSKLGNMMGQASGPFSAVLPDQLTLVPPYDLVVLPQGDGLIAYTRGSLFRLQRPDNPTQQWQQTAMEAIDGEPSQRTVIAVSGDQLLIAREEDPSLLLDLTTLKQVAQLTLPDSVVPVSAVGLPGGTGFALVTSDGRLRRVELARPQEPAVAGSTLDPRQPTVKLFSQREVESVEIGPDASQVYVIHHIDQIDVLDVKTLEVTATVRPTLTRWRWLDRYVMSPLRLIIPQTGELGETIAAMVSGESAVAFEQPSGEEQLVRYNIFRPIVSCSLFMTVMLTIGCVYFSTRDF